MAHYLIQASYTPETWAAQIKNPQNRNDVMRPVFQKLGGKMVGDQSFLAFGQHDIVGICELPDNVSAGALALAVAASGAVKAFQTTPLMTWDEGVKALQKAEGVGYQPPG
jgi:uncharacterized protein with GYD domain